MQPGAARAVKVVEIRLGVVEHSTVTWKLFQGYRRTCRSFQKAAANGTVRIFTSICLILRVVKYFVRTYRSWSVETGGWRRDSKLWNNSQVASMSQTKKRSLYLALQSNTSMIYKYVTLRSVAGLNRVYQCLDRLRRETHLSEKYFVLWTRLQDLDQTGGIHPNVRYERSQGQQVQVGPGTGHDVRYPARVNQARQQVVHRFVNLSRDEE